MYVFSLMNQIHDLYYEAVEKNNEAFVHGLYTDAHQSLFMALHCAFELQSTRKLVKVEAMAQEQLQKLEELAAPIPSPLEPEVVHRYRLLRGMVTTYRTLAENLSHGDASVVESSCMDGHNFEEITRIDEQSKAIVSTYAIDGKAAEPDQWDFQHTSAQEHEKTTLLFPASQ